VAEKFTVPRAQVARILGLPSDADDGTLLEKLDALAESTRRSEVVSAAEREARAQDRRLVIAAVNDGRLTAKSIDLWCGAMQKDRAANRAVLASLAPGLPPEKKLVVDPDMESVYDRMMSPFGDRPLRSQVVAASSSPHGGAAAAVPDRRAFARPNAISAPIPEDAVITAGRPPWTWTEEEVRDAALWNQGFQAGVKPPPSYAWEVPPVPGSEADVENAWRGTGYYQDGGV
jgi:hypothetical protein